jgi:transposase-like protein
VGRGRTLVHGRAAIQRSNATAKELAKRHGINPKTIAMWKKRTSVHDAPVGPKEPRSTVLSLEDEAIAVAFRKHTLFLLDDCRKLHLFVAIARTSKFAFAELHEKRREP